MPRNNDEVSKFSAVLGVSLFFQRFDKMAKPLHQLTELQNAKKILYTEDKRSMEVLINIELKTSFLIRAHEELLDSLINFGQSETITSKISLYMDLYKGVASLSFREGQK